MGAVPEVDAVPGDPPYVAAYGLRGAPFGGDRPGSRYRDSAILQRLNLLRHLIQSTDLLIVVQAPAGGGKTTALGELSSLADETWRVATIAGADIDDTAGLYRALAAVLIDAPPPGAGDAALRAELARLRADALLPVVLVDDAHRLPGPVLEALLSLAYPTSAASARIVLFAEPSLHTILEQMDPPSGARRSLHVEALAPLTLEQTEAYLMHRLLAAGLSGAGPFSARQIKKIHRVAQGLPGAVNEQAHRLLVDSVGRGPHRAQPAALRLLPALGMLVLAGLVAVGLIGLQGPLGRWLASPARTPGGVTTQLPLVRAQPPATVMGPVAVPAAAPAPAGRNRSPHGAGKGSSSAGSTGAGSGAGPAHATAGPTRTVPAPSGGAAGSAHPAPSASGGSGAAPATSTRGGDGKPPTALSDASRTPAVPATSAHAEPNRAPLRDTGSPAPPRHAAKVQPQPRTSGRATTSAPASNPPSASARSRSVGGVRSPVPAHGSGWLLRQDPNHFTIQVIAVRRLKTLSHLVSGRHWKVPVAWFPVRRPGAEKLYALVYGIYPSRAAAMRAAAALPRSLHAAHPWVRKLASVQDTIRRAGGP